MLKLLCFLTVVLILGRSCFAGSWFSFTQEGQGLPAPVFTGPGDSRGGGGKGSEDILDECHRLAKKRASAHKPLHILLGRSGPPVINDLCDQLLKKKRAPYF